MGCLENLKKSEPYRFKKGQSGNPAGRPKNRVPEAMAKIIGKGRAKKFYSLTELEINMWESNILTMNLSQIQLLAKWEDAPAYAKGLAISILYDLKNGSTKTLDKLRDRQFGKPSNKIEMTGEMSFANFLMKTGTINEDQDDDPGNEETNE
jgi:hypothetical protein